VVLIDHLQARGLAVRAPVAKGRRSNGLHLTAARTALIPEAAQAHEQHVERVRAAVGEPGVSAFLEALRAVANLPRM